VGVKGGKKLIQMFSYGCTDVGIWRSIYIANNDRVVVINYLQADIFKGTGGGWGIGYNTFEFKEGVNIKTYPPPPGPWFSTQLLGGENRE
jgi:hypothetical protein